MTHFWQSCTFGLLHCCLLASFIRELGAFEVQSFGNWHCRVCSGRSSFAQKVIFDDFAAKTTTTLAQMPKTKIIGDLMASVKTDSDHSRMTSITHYFGH